MYSYSICICLVVGPNVSVFYLHLSISKVFAFIFVSADNNHSQRAQMPKQASKKPNFSANIWKFLHTLENLTNTICICRQIGKLASICILFVFVRVPKKAGPNLFVFYLHLSGLCIWPIWAYLSASKSICLWRCLYTWPWIDCQPLKWPPHWLWSW